MPTTVVGASSARIVTVVGDAGIGKSRLLYEFDNWLELLPESVYFFAGRAYPNRARLAVRAGAQRARADRFDILDSDTDATTVRRSCGSGSPACSTIATPMSSATGSDSTPAGTRRSVDSPDRPTCRRSPAHLVAWLRGSAAGRPITVLLEDLHWADDESLDLFAARRRAARRHADARGRRHPARAPRPGATGAATSPSGSTRSPPTPRRSSSTRCSSGWTTCPPCSSTSSPSGPTATRSSSRSWCRC